MTWVFVLCAVSWCNVMQTTSGITAGQCRTLLALAEMSRKHTPADSGYAACVAPDGQAFTRSQQVAER